MYNSGQCGITIIAGSMVSSVCIFADVGIAVSLPAETRGLQSISVYPVFMFDL